MRLGVFGGTFDPPHVGHLLVAVDAVEALGLDRLVWIPAGRQPLKGEAGAGAEHRLAMTRLATAGDARFDVSPIEIRRPGLSFMVETLRALHDGEPGAAWHLLLGADAAALLPQWREAAEVVRLARLVVLARAGDGGATLDAAMAAAAAAGAGEPIRLAVRRVDVSSTEVRARAAEGRTLRGFVPDQVADYITAHGLYRRQTA